MEDTNTNTNTIKEILNAIAPHGPHSARKRLNRMGAMRYVTLPDGSLTFNVRSHQWDGVRITPWPEGSYNIKLWRSYRVPDLRNPARQPYREQIHYASSLKELGRIFKEEFLETRFRALAKKCREDLTSDSSLFTITRHPAYNQILGMKEKAVPLLLQELRDNGGQWFEALRVLTHASPVPRRYRDNVPLSTVAWLQWGGERTDIWTNIQTHIYTDIQTGTQTDMRPLFYTGVHHPQMASGLERSMISINVLENRKRDFQPNRWLLDSGAFTRISRGKEHMPIPQYAQRIERWSRCGQLEAAVAQDWMCEPHVLRITDLTVTQHQRLSTQRWLELREMVKEVYVMPVIQGWEPESYLEHLTEMSPELPDGAWVGVGSVCKRQGNPKTISAILTTILNLRPDLRLHGFGVKTQALKHADISSRFHSTDSMAWSYHGRRQDPQMSNSLSYAQEWTDRVNNCEVRTSQSAMI